MKDIKEYIGKGYGVLCKSKEEWGEILKLINSNYQNNFYKCPSRVLDLSSNGGFFGTTPTAEEIITKYNYKIFKASEFLSNTSELNELPEKWCVLTSDSNRKEIHDFIKSKGYTSNLTEDYYIHFPFKNGLGSAYTSIQIGYTEISFENFQRLVLNKSTMKYNELPKYWVVKNDGNGSGLFKDTVINYLKKYYTYTGDSTGAYYGYDGNEFEMELDAVVIFLILLIIQ